jgi:adenylylsulfate kinase
MAEQKATNIVWHEGHVSRFKREELLGQHGGTVWFTGLPSSGKSTIAFSVEHDLIRRGRLAYVLDGDNVRHGLNKNLGFSAEDRAENIRRIGEVCKLFADTGIICLASFVSPYIKDRDGVRQIHDEAGLPFLEIYVDVSVKECEKRDPKGLYAKARKGEIKGFTGIDDPYEPPHKPDLILKNAEGTVADAAAQVLALLEGQQIVSKA